MRPGEETAFRLLRTRNVLALTALLPAFAGLERDRPILVAWAALQVAFLVALFALGAYQASRLEVRRRIAPGAFEDETISAELFVANRGLLAAHLVEVGDRFLPAEYSYKRVLASAPIERGTIASLVYSAHCFKRRGRYQIGPAYVRLSDPLGLFRHERSFPLLDDFLVYPATVPLERLALEGESPRPGAGLASPRRVGDSPAFRGTRDWRTGDEARTIHWPSTARRGRPIVKELDREAARLVTVFCDLQEAHLAGLGHRSTLEYGVKIAASLARQVLAGRGMVQLFGSSAEEIFVPPGAGRRHLFRILAALVLARQDGGVPFTELLAREVPRLPRGSAAVLVTGGLEPDESALEEVATLCHAREILPVVVLLDAASFLQLREAATPERRRRADELAARLAGLATVYLVRAEGELAAWLERPWQPGSEPPGDAEAVA